MRPITSDAMRRIDRRAREEFGIPEMILMEHAGKAVAQVARRGYRRSPKKRGKVVVLAGGGANGGDGFVAARHLDNWGIPVEVLLLADPQRIGGAAQRNLDILHRLGVSIRGIASVRSWSLWVRARHPVRVVIDALLGTGFSGLVREPFLSAIRWLNRQRVPVISVDLPSGLLADTGCASPVAVRATCTVTCGLPKIGLTMGEGPSTSGRVVVADISLPRVFRGK